MFEINFRECQIDFEQCQAELDSRNTPEEQKKRQHFYNLRRCANERTIARMFLLDRLEEFEIHLSDHEVPFDSVIDIIERVTATIADIAKQVEAITAAGQSLDREGFAQHNKEHPLFPLIMLCRKGRLNETHIRKWYMRRQITKNFNTSLVFE